ncbi:MAG: adenylate/guanylate cyclase domain-containing protein [Verrucomicrobiota bacterium]|nr:adenylate/guanylate cyclase domain-containing protein [Verrucomicrobiota bacterium]
MKRLLPALTIGVLVSAVVLTLHISGLALRFEFPLSGWISRSGEVTKLASDKLQFPIVFILAAGVAWLTLETKRRDRLALVIGALLLELFAVAWVCGLYHTFFQPLPAMLAAALALGGSIAFIAARRWLRERAAAAAEARAAAPPPPVAEPVPEPALPPQPTPVVERFVPPPQTAAPPAPLPPPLLATSPPTDTHAYEVTAVVCDIGNKHDLLDELEPAAFVEIAQRFFAHATKAFSDAGAYVDSASGEGVVAIFGYPSPDAAHAEKATREAMRIVDDFPSANGEEAPQFELHVGVSSGKVIVAPSQHSGSTLTVGEPIELARRFCIANRFYGSRVLIGPGTFELAADSLMARPIDFLPGVDPRERHEIYEPLSASTEAAPEDLKRRDSFWNGVVLYREKRWAEAYAQFQQARGPHDDAPLQLYLRRLEPLALQLTEAPFDE